MNMQEYEILIDGTVIASNMTLGTAMILLKALFEEHYEDPTLMISVKRMSSNDGGREYVKQ